MQVIEQLLQPKQITKITFRVVLLCISMMVLNACAVHKASFDCPNSKGMGCGSMIGVYDAIKSDNFPKGEENFNNSVDKRNSAECINCAKDKNKSKSSISPSSGTAEIVMSHSYKNNNYFGNKKIYRSEDQIMRIWFNSYFDEHNNFYDSQYVYTIIQPSEWVLYN